MNIKIAIKTTMLAKPSLIKVVNLYIHATNTKYQKPKPKIIPHLIACSAHFYQLQIF